MIILKKIPTAPVYVIYIVKDVLFVFFFLQAATLPMSIIIVGVGDADFEGKFASRW